MLLAMMLDMLHAMLLVMLLAIIAFKMTIGSTEYRFKFFVVLNLETSFGHKKHKNNLPY